MIKLSDFNCECGNFKIKPLKYGDNTIQCIYCGRNYNITWRDFTPLVGDENNV